MICWSSIYRQFPDEPGWLNVSQEDVASLFKHEKANFRLLWLCIMNVGWRERNHQDATNQMFIIKLLSQHVSGIIMPIIRRTRPCITAYGVLQWLCGAGSQAVCTQLAPHNHSQHNQYRTPYVVIHGLDLPMMGIMMPKTCWDRSLIINIWLVASCWFLSLHPMRRSIAGDYISPYIFHDSLKPHITSDVCCGPFVLCCVSVAE